MIHAVSPTLPSLFSPIRSKDIQMAVAIFITQIVIHSLREWGDDIRLEGAEATRREKALRQRRSGEVQHVREALYRRLEQVTKTGESLSPSNYLQPKKNNL